MHVRDLFATQRTTFSFEFFPPRSSEAAETLYKTIRELQPLKPSFVSVTYGAGGSTRDLTHDLVLRIKNETQISAVPHLTSIGHNQAEIRAILQRYASHGIHNLLALGGDPPRGLEAYDRASDAFRYAADLVRFIRQFNATAVHPDPRGFGIGVAGFPEGHPATPNRLAELDYLKAKVDAGADYICTQLFFDNHEFHDFRDRCDLAGIHIPIIAGIMPISSVSNMRRMADLAAGTRFPAPLLRAIQSAGDDAHAVTRAGIDWATQQCRDLLDHHVHGLHFYTLNQSAATRQIYQNLGARDSQSLQSQASATRE
jgi:methylenetetrahydrofolate reductase (NADPH)